MIAGVADTHAALWYLYDDARLSARAGGFIDTAAMTGNKTAVSSVSFAEIVYLIEKKRLSEQTYADLRFAVEGAEYVFQEVHFTSEIVHAMRHVRRADVPDMPDRMIAATALYEGVPIISRDGKIRTSSLQTIW